MTFAEFKTELIDRMKRSEINQFLHLYIKTTDWNSIIKVMKQAGVYQWNFDHGVITHELLAEIPTAELEAELFYNSNTTLSDINSTIHVIGGTLTLNQSGTNRCKVILLGGSLVAESIDNSMIEIESYLNSDSTITANDTSFIHFTANKESTAVIEMKDNSIVKLINADKSNISVSLLNDSYLNVISIDNSLLHISDITKATIKQDKFSNITTDEL
jgi:hypothetical protein